MSAFFRKYRFEIALFLTYLLLAVVFTWPLILNLNNSIYGVRGDHFAQLWESWWRKGALLSGESLTYTDLIYAPEGFDFSNFPVQPLPTILNLGLTLLTNEVLAMNVLLLLSFPLAGMTVYFLVKRILRRPQGSQLQFSQLAAAFSGLVYSFSMYHFSHAWEHSTLVSIFWMPLYVLCWLKMDSNKTNETDGTNKCQYWRAIVAALAFSLVLLDNFYYGYLVIWFTVFWVLFRFLGSVVAALVAARKRRQGQALQLHFYLRWPRLKLFFLFALFSLLFTLPATYPMIRNSLAPQNVNEAWLVTESYERSEHDLNWFSARPWFYVLPSVYHPIWGKYSQAILNWIQSRGPDFITKPYARVEHNLYLTWTGVTLAAIAVLTVIVRGLESRIRNQESGGLRSRSLVVSLYRCLGGSTVNVSYVTLFLFLGLTMAIFSAPPFVTLSGIKIYFPAYFLHQIFPMFSAYARFGVLVLLCVSVLAGSGLYKILSYLSNLGTLRTLRLRSGQLTVVTGFFSALVLLEVWLPSFNVDLTPSKVYDYLKDQPGDFIVVEFPPRSDHSALLYQRYHSKRLFNPTAEHPHDVLYAPEDQVSERALQLRKIREDPQPLIDAGVKYLIFHANDPLLDFPMSYFGGEHFELVMEDGDVGLFELNE